ncbi:hypothetical protein [Rhodoferax antarcticus]|uniref:hypothetical protein n=1 Tax=Rhodoferax antarcticus TaxID=81479 RepID=UPI0022251F5A|nr:hypothetical protein [Rhodoferax antarcticus]MCW2314288.1 hypothetical protein [Rhodoferax antarcticus]
MLGCDSKGQAIAEPHEIPVECGVMVFKNKLFEVTRMVPKRTVSNLPFWVWMELAKATAKRRSDLENPQAVAKAVQMVSGLTVDKKSCSERILQNAQVNDGYRVVPDARKTHAKLEEAKARFENLVEPIASLQRDLVLAAAMDPDGFRITPILLLGEPGIGKTYLATQLAEALSVATDKISAGGAQGGFQLTGSWWCASMCSARLGRWRARLCRCLQMMPICRAGAMGRCSPI